MTSFYIVHRRDNEGGQNPGGANIAVVKASSGAQAVQRANDAAGPDCKFLPSEYIAEPIAAFCGGARVLVGDSGLGGPYAVHAAYDDDVTDASCQANETDRLVDRIGELERQLKQAKSASEDAERNRVQSIAAIQAKQRNETAA